MRSDHPIAMRFDACRRPPQHRCVAIPPAEIGLWELQPPSAKLVPRDGSLERNMSVAPLCISCHLCTANLIPMKTRVATIEKTSRAAGRDTRSLAYRPASSGLDIRVKVLNMFRTRRPHEAGGSGGSFAHRRRLTGRFLTSCICLTNTPSGEAPGGVGDSVRSGSPSSRGTDLR